MKRGAIYRGASSKDLEYYKPLVPLAKEQMSYRLLSNDFGYVVSQSSWDFSRPDHHQTRMLDIISHQIYKSLSAFRIHISPIIYLLSFTIHHHADDHPSNVDHSG